MISSCAPKPSRDAQGALASYGKGLDLARTTGDINNENLMLWAAISAATWLQTAEAKDVCREALTRLYDTRYWLLVWRTVDSVAGWLAATGNLEAATVIYGHLDAHHPAHGEAGARRRSRALASCVNSLELSSSWPSAPRRTPINSLPSCSTNSPTQRAHRRPPPGILRARGMRSTARWTLPRRAEPDDPISTALSTVDMCVATTDSGPPRIVRSQRPGPPLPTRRSAWSTTIPERFGAPSTSAAGALQHAGAATGA